MKLTEWFPGSIEPVRKGVYQTEDCDGMRWFNYFDGKCWHYGGRTVDDAETWPLRDGRMSPNDEFDNVVGWRGVRKAARRKGGMRES